MKSRALWFGSDETATLPFWPAADPSWVITPLRTIMQEWSRASADHCALAETGPSPESPR